MAKGLNFFVGLEYTPAALSFLLRERQWRMGAIEKLQEQIDDARREIELSRSRIRTCPKLKGPEGYRIGTLEAQIKELLPEIGPLQDDITALDRVIAMHPVKVDLSNLPAVRKRRPDLLPRGHLERGVLNELRLVRGENLTTAEIARALALKHGIDTTPGCNGWQRLRRACVQCLNYLAETGRVKRLHARQTNGDGFWTLSGEQDLG